VRPSDASIKLTENCQARCVTCDYWKHHWTDKIDTGSAVHLITRLGEIGVTTLRFTGGEPLLRKDFFNILATVDPTPFQTISVQTNGLLLQRFADQVNASPITHVTVSLDATGETNDKIRGITGYFERAVAGLAKIHGKTRIIAMTLNQAGAADLDSLIDYTERLGGYLACNLPDNRLYFLQNAELAGLWPDEKTSEHLVTTLARRLGRQFTARELAYMRRYLRSEDPTLRATNPPCILGYTNVYIASDGSVRSGCYVLPPIGNILDRDIAEILDAPGYREQAQAMLRLECPGCACNVFKSIRTTHAVQDAAKKVYEIMAPSR
jgi:MoaA/NifB/PqqE/SkfB family radical SAM enzyme